MCQAAAAATKPAAKDYDALFDDDDDDDAELMDEGLSDTKSPVKKAAVDQEEDEDFLMPSTGRIRNRGAILDDENSMGERGLAGLCYFQFSQSGASLRLRLSHKPNATTSVSAPLPLQTPGLCGSARTSCWMTSMAPPRSPPPPLPLFLHFLSTTGLCPPLPRRPSSRAPLLLISRTASW